MFSKTTLLALAALAAVEAAPQGFNYGSTMNGAARSYQDFYNDFKGAQGLDGAPGTFNSARLYTMLDAADGTSVIPALKAAMDTKTYLLLGLWASGDPAGFTKEMNALKQAISSMPDLAQYVLGISVGSEDLYRISPTGLSAPDAAPGNGPDVIVDYIKQVRSALSGSSWSKVSVGHVDTWTAWVNGTNSPVIENSDFLGVDAYPYYQKQEDNPISNGASLFNEAMDNTRGVAGGKPVWITETGWPLTGPSPYGQAEVGVSNAETYWQDVGCPNFGTTPTFWYTLYDGVSESQNGTTPSFSIVKDSSSYEPAFPLSCSNVKNSTSTSSSSTAASSGFSTATASGSSSTSTGSSGSGSSNGTYTGTPSQPTTSGTSGSGSSGSGSATGGAPSGSASTISTSGASSLSFSLTSMAAVAALAVAFL